MILEDRNVAYNVTLLDYDNFGKATFSWNSNTTGLFLKDHVFNISIVTTNGTIVQQIHNIKNKEFECSALEKYTNFTFTIQSKNKYTFSNPLQYKFMTYGERFYKVNFKLITCFAKSYLDILLYFNAFKHIFSKYRIISTTLSWPEI